MALEQFPYFDLEAFANDFRTVVQERKLTAQQVSEQTHVARPTVHRVMTTRHMCDAPTLAILAFWAQLKVENYVMWDGVSGSVPGVESIPTLSGADSIAEAVHADPNLSGPSKNALVKALKALYSALK